MPWQDFIEERENERQVGEAAAADWARNGTFDTSLYPQEWFTGIGAPTDMNYQTPEEVYAANLNRRGSGPRAEGEYQNFVLNRWIAANTRAQNWDNPEYRDWWRDNVQGGGLGGLIETPLSHLEQTANTWSDNPEQALIGANTPFEADLWNSVLGTDYQPVVSDMGGMTDDQFAQAEAEGIRTEGAQGLYNAADFIAGIYGADALSNIGTTGSGGGGGGAGGQAGGPAANAQAGLTDPGGMGVGGTIGTGSSTSPGLAPSIYGGVTDASNAAASNAAAGAGGAAPLANSAGGGDAVSATDAMGLVGGAMGGGGSGMETEVPPYIEQALQFGLGQAQNTYNQGLGDLDPNNYLDTTMQNLMAMQNPQTNPYLDSMLDRSNQAIADQVMSSYGVSGRGPGMLDPMTGQVSDTAINFIDQVGDNTRQFLGNQYQQDMNRSYNAITGGMTAMPSVLQTQQMQPYANLNAYTNAVSPLLGTSAAGPRQVDPGVSGWDRLMGLTALGMGAYNTFGGQ